MAKWPKVYSLPGCLCWPVRKWPALPNIKTIRRKETKFKKPLRKWKKLSGLQAGTEIGSAARTITLAMCLAQRRIPRDASLLSHRAYVSWRGWGVWKGKEASGSVQVHKKSGDN